MVRSRVGIRQTHGFTIVELLIVIVVIGILAAITVVAYSGVQQRAQDAKRTSDITTLVKAMTLWSIQTGKAPIATGAGYNGNGTGWVYSGAFQGQTGGYTTDIETVLVTAGVLSAGVRDPVTPTGYGSYMFYQCNTTTKQTMYAFFARLGGLKAGEVRGDYARWQAEGCAGSPLSAQYGMNYAQLFVVE